MFVEITLIYKGDEYITEVDAKADIDELINYFKENLSIDSNQECSLITRKGSYQLTKNTVLELIDDTQKTVGKRFGKKS